jgi:hypothetical protein
MQPSGPHSRISVIQVDGASSQAIEQTYSNNVQDFDGCVLTRVLVGALRTHERHDNHKQSRKQSQKERAGQAKLTRNTSP